MHFFPPLYRPDCGTGIVFSCFGHVVNIANIAVMGRVTQIAAIKNATAIWEYDPSLPGNWILGGSLDVITAIRTIAVKVSLPFFTNIKFSYVALRFKHLRIPLHSKVRWGSAHGMLEHSYKLRQVSNLYGTWGFLH